MSKKKSVKGYIKLTIGSGKANPAPPVGPALGQKKVNIMEFCKSFNDRTKDMEPGTPVPTVITVYTDNSFDFVCKTPPASFYLKKFAKIKKGSSATRKDPSIATVTISDCREIAKIKAADLNAYSEIEGARIIRGSAESMGIDVIED
jgi:large subunit ribosomal protein L11